MAKKLCSAWISGVNMMVYLAAGAAASDTQTINVCFVRQGALGAVHRTASPSTPAIQTAILELVAGPTAQEGAAGFTSWIPSGTKVVNIRLSDDGVIVDLSPEVLQDLDESTLLGIFDQFRATLWAFPDVLSIHLTCQGQLLASYLPPAPEIESMPETMSQPMRLSMMEPEPEQSLLNGTALSGRNITIGPSHGRYWHDDYGWIWQRGDPCGFGEAVLEDTNSIRLCQFLYQYLVQDGATVHVPREMNESNCCHSATGLPWWKMAARYWLQANGLPSSIWDSSTTDYNDDIRARPLFADYRGSDIYIAHHTNAFDGTASGTVTYRDTAMEHPEHEANSYILAQRVQSNVCDAIKNIYGIADWYNRGVLDAKGGFGEIRIPNRPACLIELAFHDNCTRDALYLTDNFFRSVAEWGLYKGVCQYFGASPTWDCYSDEYVSDTIPAIMNPSQSYGVSITFRNRGVVWSEARSFRLGAVGDSDPFTAFNRVNISGEVGPGQTYTFSFTMTAPAAPGTYITDWRMVRDGVTWFGATCSKQVEVGTSGPQPPSIVQHPADQTVPLGTVAAFTVQATGDSPLYYQWQKDTVDLSDGGKISGANSATLQLTGVDVPDQGVYRCVVTNALGSATSNAATLTVTAPIFMVESRSGGQNYAKYSETGGWANSGGKSTAAGVTAGIGSRYGSTYRSVAGEKHAIFGADLPAAGTYEVSVTWGANANRRTPILHRIVHAGGTTDVNVDQAATANTWVSLGVYTFGAGSDVGSVDVNNLNIDASGSMYADAVKWVYVASPPVIDQHPAVQSVCPGATATFTVAASGGGTLAYRWQKNGVNLTNGGHYSDVTTATLKVLSADVADVANYRCVVTNISGSATSNEAGLTLKAATSITQHPESQTVCPGSATGVQFAVVATGDGTVSYEWQKNSVKLTEGGHYSGVTSPALTVLNVDSSDIGTYRCLVTAGCGTATSNEAVLALRPMVTADFDEDCDVDQADYDLFAACSSGPGVPTGTGCNGKDLDGDGDVDQADFGVFQRCYSGENLPPDADCAN
ncbi:MAG TPA: immunoglobulin domain-containing protein [Phycisphaerae bacterium]|nr:immunoglobulin domain-containing protein [Phycisphaerae bacterium]HRR85214.1 immunoglobulin domain-containing protein [Phycisphaerae bacterium]